MRVIVLFFLSILLFSCKTSDKIDEYNILKKQCQTLIETKNSGMCQIINSEDVLYNQYYLLGTYYFFSTPHRDENCSKASYWYNKSIEENPKNGQPYNGLGLVHFSFCSEYYDPKKAERYFLKAVEGKESKEAPVNLGELYRYNKEYDKALHWYSQAINENPYRAYLGIAAVYIDHQNYPKAKEYLLKAAELNHPEAQYNLGVMYYEGLGVEVDKAVAKEWFLKALNNGFERANVYLQEYK